MGNLTTEVRQYLPFKVNYRHIPLKFKQCSEIYPNNLASQKNMNIAFILLVLLHGLIHILGFVKAFGLAEVKQLTVPIPKMLGILWLIAFLLSVALAVAIALGLPYWWALALLVATVSQVLIFSSWRDAKYGSIVNGILLVVAVIGYFAGSK